ncbi:MAG: hypothetical protein HY726_08185 [Candidatus Rokubacteria bacterium]|nr:hypothetical protein [Candidatus Rokubacteria bacterium]
MTASLGFRLSAIVGDQYPEMEVPPVDELLARLQTGEVSGEAVIYPTTGDFPRAMIDWHAGHGFVLLCFDNEASRGHFLARGPVTSQPSVSIVLGGQAMERWPPELFVPEDLAADGLRVFVDAGQRKPSLRWVRLDRFRREVVWEGRAARSAWEERQRRHGDAR